MGCPAREELQNLLHLINPNPITSSRSLTSEAEKPLDGTWSPLENSTNLVDWRKKRAAVLICLFHGYQGELRVILTKRSMKLSCYPGDVALPGGKTEEGDADDPATALREAMEEIGLDPKLVRIVYNLEAFTTKHQLKVVPVVGVLAKKDDFKPVPNADEVDSIFDVPLDMFLKEENHRCEEKEWMGRKYVVHLFDYKCEHGDFLIWGLTASILIRAASTIYRQSPVFFDHLPDFQQLQRELPDNCEFGSDQRNLDL